MSNPAIVLDLIDAFRRSKTMFTAAAMGVFDRTPATLADLAVELNANVDALERLLDGCVGLGLLVHEGDTYRNSEVSEEYLSRKSPKTMAGYVTYSDRVLYQLWGNLGDAVREGSHRWLQTFGVDGPIFNHFFRTPEARAEFLLGMHGLGMASSAQVVAAFDLGGYRKLVDLGGGTGHLAMAARGRYPGLHAAVFDLPEAIETAKQFVDDRVELIPGDFFSGPLPAADLYALGRILHDWSEPKIRALLAKIHASLPAGGALLIAERLLNPDKSGPVTALMQSLNMLCCTEGKERTLAEYEALLTEAGFRHVEGVVTGAVLDAVIARKT
jgi:acetylserotonin N-methyltransferase